MRVVEHWWNGSWGNLFRRDVRLQLDTGRHPRDCPYANRRCHGADACRYASERCAAGIWQLYVRYGKDEATFDYRNETDARTQLDLLLTPEYGPWKRLDTPSRSIS